MKRTALFETEGLKARCTPEGRFVWPYPACLGQEALVVGPAPCLHEDVARLPDGTRGMTVFAVNRAVRFTPTRVDHVVTCHPDSLEAWVTPRWMGQLAELDIQVHSTASRPCVDFVWGFNPGFGSSGGLAVFIALCMGFSRIYLAGVPLENTGYADDPTGGADYSDFHETWRRNLPLMRGRVFSLSSPETFTGSLLPLDR